MNTILVPLDGSALAEQVLPHARVLASALDAKIRLLEVVQEPERDSMLADSITGLYGMGEPAERHRERKQLALEDARARAEGYLAVEAGRLQEDGLEVEVEVRIGPAAENIAEAAAAGPPTLIAMATHGYGGLRRWALGSVADRVVQSGPAPIFLVRGVEHPRVVSGIRRILVPLDGSDLARQALPAAVELARGTRADIVLLQSVAPVIEGYPSLFGQLASQYGAVLEALHEAAERELRLVAEELRKEDLSVSIAVANGHPAEMIVDEAAHRGASLIVMATHGRGGLRRWALGSVADKVLHATSTPLVLVRAK